LQCQRRQKEKKINGSISIELDDMQEYLAPWAFYCTLSFACLATCCRYLQGKEQKKSASASSNPDR
jgi:hypothetical protein